MKVLIVRNNYSTEALDASLMILTYLQSQGIEGEIREAEDMPTLLPCSGDEQACSYDLAIVLGGDGSILRTARVLGTCGVPLMGINFGNLGFLANSSEAGIIPLVSAALTGEVAREERTSLRVDVIYEDPETGEPSCNLDEPFIEAGKNSYFALNEVTFSRGVRGRIITCAFAVAGEQVASMRGDGLIVATATGSTAYSLSAGGPLVSPSYSGLIVVPLAPHTLRSRALLTAPQDVVEVDLSENDLDRNVVIFIDGEPLELPGRPLKALVRKNVEPTVLLRYQHPGFYSHASRVFFTSETQGGQ